MVIKNVDEEQGLSWYGLRNTCQYDMTSGSTLVASLWKGDNDCWYWTKRLYEQESNYELGEYFCDVNEIISDFIERVTRWLEDECDWLTSLYDELAGEDIVVKNE